VILPMIYRKPEIAAAAALLWPLSLTIVCEAARGASSIALLATRRTRIVFLARIAALAAFACAGATLGYLMDYTGLLWANAVGTAVGAAVVMAAAMKAPATASAR
jgi:hypothetical protein